MIKISISARVHSFNHKQVSLNLYLTNENDSDYYFYPTSIYSYCNGILKINNTAVCRIYGEEWQSCTTYTCPSKLSTQSKYKLLKGETYSKSFNINDRCSFLNLEPKGHQHWLSYSKISIPFYRSFENEAPFDVIRMPVLELPFVLIDEEDGKQTLSKELEDTAIKMDITGSITDSANIGL